MRLFQQTGNLRGETQCLMTLAGLSFKQNDPKKTTELLNRALEKGGSGQKPHFAVYPLEVEEALRS